MPASPEVVAAYLREMAEKQYMIATIQGARAGISDAHRKASHPDSPSDSMVIQVVNDFIKNDTRKQVRAKPLNRVAMARVREAAFIPRKTKGRSQRVETEAAARARGLLDIVICSVMRDGMLRISEAAALRWGDIQLLSDGTGRLSIPHSKTDQVNRVDIVYLDYEAALDLQPIRPDKVVNEVDTLVFGLSVAQLGRRIREAAKAADLGDGYSGHSGRVGMAQDLAEMGIGMTPRYTTVQEASRGAVAQYYQQFRIQRAFA